MAAHALAAVTAQARRTALWAAASGPRCAPAAASARAEEGLVLARAQWHGAHGRGHARTAAAA